MTKIQMFELILAQCYQDPYPFFKILICRIRNRLKMDRIRNPGNHPGAGENSEKFLFLAHKTSTFQKKIPDDAGSVPRSHLFGLIYLPNFSKFAVGVGRWFAPKLYSKQIRGLCAYFLCVQQENTRIIRGFSQTSWSKVRTISEKYLKNSKVWQESIGTYRTSHIIKGKYRFRICIKLFSGSATLLMNILCLKELMGELVRCVEPWAINQFPSLVHPTTGLDSFRAFTVHYAAENSSNTTTDVELGTVRYASYSSTGTYFIRILNHN